MVFRLVIEYDGTNYYGWQIQPDVPTIQGELEKALGVLIRVPFKLVGAGRTDRGVHARGQVASLHIERDLRLSASSLRSSLNGLLSKDIFVREVSPAPEDFNARKSARLRIYRYTVSLGRSPLLARFAWEYKGPEPKMALLARMAGMLVGERDMRAFSPGAEPPTTMRIKRALWEREGRVLWFWIAADRFIYKVVRNLVGTMMRVATGAEAPELFEAALAGRAQATYTAPAKGLCLWQVEY